MSKQAPAQIKTTPSFRRQFQKKTPATQGAVARTLKLLGEDWRHPGLRTHRLQGRKDLFEARIDRGNRLTFYWEGSTMWLQNTCKHSILDRD